jgi:hypothetical protein
LASAGTSGTKSESPVSRCHHHRSRHRSIGTLCPRLSCGRRSEISPRAKHSTLE